MSVQTILSETEARMKQAIEAMVHDFSTYRTGRANPSILERVHVDYYGSEVPINQVANVSVPEPDCVRLPFPEIAPEIELFPDWANTSPVLSTMAPPMPEVSAVNFTTPAVAVRPPLKVSAADKVNVPVPD